MRGRQWLLTFQSVLLTCVVLITAEGIGHAQANLPEVVLLRGGAGYWPGVRAIADDLKDHGFAPRIAMGSLYPLEVSEIASNFQSGRQVGPVTIVGYSSGADFACRMSASLESRGIPVTTLVLIESTLGTPVPANVELCVNMYESRPNTDWLPVFRGIPVEAVSPNTELMNLDVKSTDQLQWLTQYNHFTMGSGSEMRVLIRNLLLLRQSQFLQKLQVPPATPVDLPPPAAPQPDLQTRNVPPPTNVTPVRMTTSTPNASRNVRLR